MKTTVTKEITWDMAHRLSDYNGPCKNLHGHTYKLQVTIGHRLGIANSIGMIIDFNDLKDLMNEIKSKFDHTCVLEGKDNIDKALIKALKAANCRVFVTGYVPTAENMLQHIAEFICNELDEIFTIDKIRLYETPTSYAEVTCIR